MATPKLKAYNLSEVGVIVDLDNLHAPVNAFRQTQNMHAGSFNTLGSLVNRYGLTPINGTSMAASILGGTVVPVFKTGDSVDYLFVGFGEAV